MRVFMFEIHELTCAISYTSAKKKLYELCTVSAVMTNCGQI